MNHDQTWVWPDGWPYCPTNFSGDHSTPLLAPGLGTVRCEKCWVECVIIGKKDRLGRWVNLSLIEKSLLRKGMKQA